MQSHAGEASLLVSLRRIKGLFPFKCKGASAVTTLNAAELPCQNPLIDTVNPNWWNNDKTQAKHAQCFVNQLWHFILSEIMWGMPKAASFHKY